MLSANFVVKTAGNTTNLHFHLNRCHPDIQKGLENKSAGSLKRKQMVIYHIKSLLYFKGLFSFFSLINVCFMQILV